MCLLQGPTSCMSSPLQCHTWTVQSRWGNANQRENQNGLLEDVVGGSIIPNMACWPSAGEDAGDGNADKGAVGGLLG